MIPPEIYGWFTEGFDTADLCDAKKLLDLGIRALIAPCYVGLARLYRRIGKRTESDEHFATADDDVRERGMTYWREKAEAER